MSNLRQLPKTVVVLGAVSFFNDLASEMVTPLIPILLAAVLGVLLVAFGVREDGRRLAVFALFTFAAPRKPSASCAGTKWASA